MQFDQWRRTMAGLAHYTPTRSQSASQPHPHPMLSTRERSCPATGALLLRRIRAQFGRSSRGLQPQDGRAQRFDCCSVHRGRVTRLLHFACALFVCFGLVLHCAAGPHTRVRQPRAHAVAPLPTAISSVGHCGCQPLGQKSAKTVAVAAMLLPAACVPACHVH